MSNTSRFNKFGLLIFTGAQPKAATGHKMQSISVVFSTLHCEGYIAGSLLLGVLAGSLKFIRHFKKHEAWRTVNRKTIAFWGTIRSPAFTMHKFMNENLRVNIWRDNFTSNYLRVNLPSSSIEKLIENKSDLSKLSTLSEPSIVKFVKNQSEHLSKLTLYHLKKCATRWSRRARESSRIPLLRVLKEKNSILKKFVEVFKAPSPC